jgi:hypothetical protein
MRNQQLPVDEVNVRFDAAKAVLERVEQRTGMLVIVVGVRVTERRGEALRQSGAARKDQAEQTGG